MSLLALAGTNSATGGYDIDNSLKLEADNTEYLTRTPSSDSNRKTFTTSLWVKRTELGNGVSGANQTLFGAQPSSGYTNANTFQWGFTHDDKFGLGLQTYWVIQTNRVFRDTSAWYHIVVRTDTTQASSSDRIKVYINGVQDTSFSVSATVTQDQLLGVNHTTRHQIGSLIANSWHSKCYIAEINHIDGQSLDPTYFGKFDDDTGIWKPKAYTGSYGTNGFFLDFSDSSSLGNDASSNNNNWTLNNITAADQATDTPTNNFCTMNMLNRTDGNIKNQEGATKITTDGGSGWCNMIATMGITKGKWYWEAERASSDGNNVFAGVADSEDIYIPHNTAAKYYLGNVVNTTSVGWYFDNGQVYNGNATFAAPSANDKVMIALDFDNQAIYFGVNGTWGNSSDPESGASKTGASVYAFNNADWDNFCMPAFTVYQGQSVKVNFGGYTCMSIASANSDADGYGTFEYAPPTGYYALCTKNLEEYG